MSRTTLGPAPLALVIALVVGCVIGGVVGAGVGRGMREPELQVLRDQVEETQRTAADARRDEGEWRAVADAERLRTQAARERLAHVSIQQRAAPVEPAREPGSQADGAAGDAAQGHGGMEPTGVTQEIAPEMWERPRLNMEIEFLSTKSDELSIKNPRFERVLRAIEAQPDRGSALLAAILASGLGDSMKSTAAALVAAARTPGCGEAVMGVLETATETKLRRRLLAAAARGRGDEPTGYLLALWKDEKAPPPERAIAGTGLGLRAHPVALEVIRGDAEATPPLRARVLEGLYRRAYEAEWAAEELIPEFRKALASADGPSQRNVALGALEGYWSEAGLPELDALAATAGVEPKMRQRATSAAAGIRAGRARPPGLGELDLLGRRVRQRSRNTPVAPAGGPQKQRR